VCENVGVGEGHASSAPWLVPEPLTLYYATPMLLSVVFSEIRKSFGSARAVFK
jgi:hypothetical protein